ncbi:MAG: indolepyruvate ferredoxin oxidoreductase family protein [Alphaproteobacteria bacterium]|nr:indolepyruvate ferredoxin oxidoreductase family protein [Alphaproteobacteria bacterium]
MSGVQLSDCYTARSGPALFNGMQALVRLLLEQARLDRDMGLNTRGLVSGYPGSPLGGLDLELGRAKPFLDEDGIVFQPGLNEELAATALWGSQHIGLYDDSVYDGVFGLWYGKGPGLDRSMDALRHANHGGVAPKGGMVIAVGDDPTGKSSTLAYQSDQTFQALGIPYFFPRRVEDIIPMGLKAFALSRHAGVCVGLKMVIDTADANVILETSALRPELVAPAAAADVHVGRHDHASLREARLHQLRLPAAQHWQRCNPVNHVMGDEPANKKLGIIAVGKAVIETLESFQILGLDAPHDHGIGLFSVAMPWPLDPGQIRGFAEGYDEILVIEEKRGLVEDQIAKILINTPDAPRLTGKTAPDGESLMPPFGELSVELITSALARRAAALGMTLAAGEAAPDLGNLPAIATRTPYYCAGCPHNSSTKLPGGEIAGMGIGCHSISGFLTPDQITNFTQMGGEGAFWIGRAPFSSRHHTLQNMGDGTYTHSGYLGVRAAVASGVNMTFKILYNDAVAMTGGQDAMGGSTPDAMARQMIAEGVKAVSVVGDDPDGTRSSGTWPEGTQFHHRRDLIQVQEDLSRVKGTTALLYVQTCAAELRRRRKRGKIADRTERLVINEAVCEGCGDCAVKSNCVAVKPVTHPEGIKRQVDQSVCNKDYSCNEGFCPSFVSVTPKGGVAEVTRPQLPATDDNGKTLPMPPAAKRGVSNIFIAGIGGTGVSTLSAVLVMAARLEGIHAQAMNLTGLSQKNGGVTSQVRMSPDVKLDERMVRLPPRSADVLIGCDAVVAANDLALRCLHADDSWAVVNARVDPVGVAGVGAGHVVDDSLLMARFSAVMNPQHIAQHNVSDLAERLLGSTTTANVMLLGMAIQMGLVPISIAAITEALTLNGVQVEQNLNALTWGRWLAHDSDLVLRLAGLASDQQQKLDAMPAPEAIDYFTARLTAYHDQSYADRYRHHMKTMGDGMTSLPPEDRDKLLRKAARAAYRVMAIKDEYEVARLMTAPEFKTGLKAQFGDGVALAYNLAPPMMGWLKNRNGTPRKFRFGGWMGSVFAVLAKMKFLRGTALDVFGYSAERKRELEFRDMSLEQMQRMATDGADADTCDAVLEAVLSVRGYGYVKDASMTAAMTALDELSAARSPRQLNDKKHAS